MSYLKELNAFYQQIIFNPLSGSAVALWNTLMHFNNLSGWQETFSVPASLIELKSGIKGTSFKRARNELQEKGYINVTSRDGNQAAVYQMISQIRPMYQVDSLTQTEQEQQSENHPEKHLYEQSIQPTPDQQASDLNQKPATAHTYASTIQPPTSEPTKQPIAGHSVDHIQENNVSHHMDHTLGNNPAHSTDPSAAGNADHKTAHSTAPLVKQHKNQNKNKTKHKPTTTTSDAIRFYQENFGVVSSYVADDITNWINDLGDPLVLDALRRALEQNKATWRYAKGILKAWSRQGITTVEQANADETAFQSRQNNKSTQPATTTDEIVPEWFKERKRQQALEEKRKQQVGPDVMSAAEQEEYETLLAKYHIKKSAVMPDTTTTFHTRPES